MAAYDIKGKYAIVTGAGSDATTPVDFHKTDISDWGQIACLWKKTLETFGLIDIVVNGAPPSTAPTSTTRVDSHRPPLPNTVDRGALVAA
ncbi:hypothetical protein AUP68_10814 [Ilyonectria robusta]